MHEQYIILTLNATRTPSLQDKSITQSPSMHQYITPESMSIVLSHALSYIALSYSAPSAPPIGLKGVQACFAALRVATERVTEARHTTTRCHTPVFCPHTYTEASEK